MSHIYKKLFTKVLKNIVKGEKFIGGNIKNENIERQLLWLSIKRFISHSSSVVLLCRKRHNLEALMLLRPIIELVVNLRWIIEDETKKNLDQFLKYSEYEFENSSPKMGSYWTDANLLERMNKIGFKEHYYKMVIKKLHEELHANPAVIARSHNKKLTSMSSDAIFSVVYQFAGHLLKVANSVYQGKYFMDHNEVWYNMKNLRENNG